MLATAEPDHQLLAQCRASVLQGEGVEVLLATYVLQRLTGTLGPSVGLADLTVGVPPPTPPFRRRAPTPSTGS